MKKGSIIIAGGSLVVPERGINGTFDVWIEDGLVRAIDKPGSFVAIDNPRVVEAKGKLVTAGLVDIHVHLREPGAEWKETIQSGCQAAVWGGFTTVCCMPNTNPTIDNEETVRFIKVKAKEAGLARVYPIGAITVGRKGECLANFTELVDAGCVGFSDDGAPVSNALLMRRALEYSQMLGLPFALHEEDLALAHGFSMNESALSLLLGLKGMPGAAEDVMIARDIELARLTGGHAHFCHVSTARAVTLIRRAKEDGISVTAEVAPHHFTLNETAVGDYNTLAKMSMPLRSALDVEGVLEGLQQGVLDCIASDHAPHEKDSKAVEFDKASFGILGFQTTLPLTLAKVREGKLSLERAISALTSDPVRCFHLQGNCFREGDVADITIIDPELRVVLEEKDIVSKSKNTPFLGERLQGFATNVFVAGEEVFCRDERSVA